MANPPLQTPERLRAIKCWLAEHAGKHYGDRGLRLQMESAAALFESIVGEHVCSAEGATGQLSPSTTEAASIMAEALPILRSLASIKDCDEEPDQCEADSGPYCGRHGENYLHMGEAKASRALLSRVERFLTKSP